MATVTGYQSVQLFGIEVIYGDVIVASPTTIGISAGGYTGYYTGNFTYDIYGNVFGTLTGYTTYINGALAMEITDFSVNANFAYNLINANRGDALVRYVGAGDDTINGSAYADDLAGYDGNDIIRGNGGNDVIYGGAGNDLIFGGAGADRLYGDTGFDTASYIDALASITLDMLDSRLGTGDAAGDTFDSIEAVIGSLFNDIIRGTNTSDTLQGDQGNDVLVGRAGNDTLVGGKGNDTLDGGAGGDVLNGGEGIDTASYSSSSEGLTIDLIKAGRNTGDAAGDSYIGIESIIASKFNDLVFGNNVGNRIVLNNGNDSASGRGGADSIFGGGGKDKILGNGGNDKLYGDKGNDSLIGGNGSDSLFGGKGNDRLIGSAGNDILTGGGGRDVFLFKKGFDSDRITDFTDGMDKIDLASWGFDTVKAAMKSAKMNGQGDVVFDFGNGDRLVVENTLKSDLWDDLLI